MPRRLVSLLLLLFALLLGHPAWAKQTYVRGYRKKNGTYVSGHFRNTRGSGTSRSRGSSLSGYARSSGLVHVDGYRRRDGSYVRPHVRTQADGIESNNLSYRSPYGGTNRTSDLYLDPLGLLTIEELGELLEGLLILPANPVPAPVVPAKPSQGKLGVLLDYHDEYHAGRQWPEAELDEVIFIRTNLTKANFTRAWIRRADLRQAKLDGANLTKADLTTSNLSRTSLVGTNCTGATLAYTKLFKASFIDADLTDANLEGADLESAYLQGANLTGAVLDKATLKGAVYDVSTRWPAGFDPVAAGAQLSK